MTRVFRRGTTVVVREAASLSVQQIIDSRDAAIAARNEAVSAAGTATTAAEGAEASRIAAEEAAGQSQSARDDAQVAAAEAEGYAAEAGKPYPSRAAAEAADVPAPVMAIRVLHNGMILDYQSDATGTALSTNSATRNWSPANDVTPLHWGAIGYANVSQAQSGVDAAPAFQACIDWVAGKNTSVPSIYIPTGRYRLQSQLNITTGSIHLRGSGMVRTLLVVDHLDGAGIRYTRDQAVIEDMWILGSATRNAAAITDGEYPGIRVEPEDAPDSTELRVRYYRFRGVRVTAQPGHGVVLVGAFSGTAIDCDIANNKGHGWAIGHQVYPRTNVAEVPGLFEIICGVISTNGGNGVAVASNVEFSSPAVRVGLINVEINRNATDAAVRLWPAQVYMRGAQFGIERCIMAARSTDTDIEGFYVSGVSINITNNRFINCNRAGTVSSHDTLPTRSVVIDGVQMITAPGTIDPLVLVRKEGTAEPRGIEVKNFSGGTVTRPIATDATMGSAGPQRVPALRSSGPLVYVQAADQTVNNTTTMVDIADLQMWMHANQKVVFEVSIAYEGDATADIRVRLSGPSGSTVNVGSINGAKTGTDLTFTPQNVVDGNASQIVVGAAGANIRYTTIIGTAVCGSTEGYLKAQFAQGTAVSADTTIKGALSHAKFYPVLN